MGYRCPLQEQSDVALHNVGRLQCPVSVTRGDNTNCTASGPSGATFSNWSFTADSGSVVSRDPSSNGTWSGTVVAAGNVSVTVTSSVGSIVVSRHISVNPRSWHTAAASAVQVPNGSFIVLPVPPVSSGSDSGLGYYRWDVSHQGTNYTTISSGPNTGYTYYANQLTFNTLSQYEINPDLENSSSNFSHHQCGTSGFIFWNDLITQTRRHEFNSTTQSHHGAYKASFESPSNNPGDYFELQVAVPGSDLGRFVSDTDAGLTQRSNNVQAAVAVEPFPVNYSEFGQFLGNINYDPSSSCVLP